MKGMIMNIFFNTAKSILLRDKVSANEVENISPNLETEINKLNVNEEQKPKPKKYPKFGFRMWLVDKLFGLITL